MPEGQEGYQPSEGEIQAAEDHMTEREKGMSEGREEEVNIWLEKQRSNQEEQENRDDKSLEKDLNEIRNWTNKPGLNRFYYGKSVEMAEKRFGEDWKKVLKRLYIEVDKSMDDEGDIARYHFLNAETRSGEEVFLDMIVSGPDDREKYKY